MTDWLKYWLMRHLVKVDILTMKLSGDREEHWVQIKCVRNAFYTRRFDGCYYNRALYERDELRHVLLGDPKPRLIDEKYNDAP